MRTTNGILLALVAALCLMTAPAVMACDMEIDCHRPPDIKSMLQLACSDEGVDCHHIDVRGLLQLACDAETGYGCDYRKDLKGLLQLACTMEVDCLKGLDKELDKMKQLACDPDTGDGCDFRPKLDHILQLACDDEGTDCFKPDTKGQSQLASAAKPEKMKFMALSKSAGPSETIDRAEKRVKAATDQEIMERIAAASPADFPLLMKFLSKRIRIDGQDASGMTLLVWASGNGKTDAVKYLLSKGADPNCKTKGGCSPLSCAKAKGHTDVVNMLEAAGAK